MRIQKNLAFNRVAILIVAACAIVLVSTQAEANKSKTTVSIPRTQIIGTNSTPASTSDPIRRSEHPISDDLRAVVEAWPELPEAVRAGIAAMVKAASCTTLHGDEGHE